MTDNTRDFSRFGTREIAMAGELLSAYAENPNVLPGDGIAVEFNPNSGNVFLVDDDFNVAMMNGDTLEQFHSCPYCGAEGFADEIHEGDTPATLNAECVRFLKDIEIDDERTEEPEEEESEEG